MNSSHPSPSRQELVGRATKLAVTFAERRVATAEARQISDESIADMQEAGFFRMLQPRRWGGYECHPNTFFAVQQILAAACPSTAWVLGVVAVHNWQLALFSEQAQQEVWGDDSSVLISSSYMPVGKVKKVDGGYQFSGEWGFSSGSDHCDWAFLGGFVPTENGPPDMRTFLVPKGDYELIDDWHVLGLKGTGSKTVRIKDCFVPEHRTHKFGDGFKCANPGNELNTAPLFRIPFGQIFVRSVAMSALGMAQGALDAFIDVQSKRVARGDGRKVSDDPRTKQVVAHGIETIDSAKLVLERNFDDLMEYAERGERIPIETRVKYRYTSSTMVKRCGDVIDQLMGASGGSGIFASNPIGMYFCDIHAALAHYANNPDKPGANLGATALGMRNSDYFI